MDDIIEEAKNDINDLFAKRISGYYEQVERTRQEVLSQITEQMNAAINSWHEAMGRPIAEILKKYEETYPRIEQACIDLANSGWVIPLEFSPGEIIDITTNKSGDEIDDFFEKFYLNNSGKELEKVLQKVNENFSSSQWADLIDESIWAYKNAHYLIVIPSLLSILEGYLVINLQKGSSKKKVKPLCAEKLNEQLEKSMSRIEWFSVGAFIEKIFKSIDFASPSPALLNRHWILHGRDEINWKPIDAIRLFVSLQTISEMLQDK